MEEPTHAPLRSAAGPWRALLFGLTLFVSAALVFAVQPMVARRLLPALGGAPAVWTTCVLFFQAGLVVGYAFADGVARLRRLRWQVLAFGALLAAGLACLPVSLTDESLEGLSRGPSPVLGLLGVLVRRVGLPYLALGATAPLLQHWFSKGAGPAARDPYYLYAASNAGSLAALAAYPFWIERTFPTAEQFRLWGLGMAALAGLVGLCAFVAGRSREIPTGAGPPEEPASFAPWVDWLWWSGLAFVPSVLMLGVTSHVTTDLAAVPLLWVVPLGLYLLSMILAFAGRADRPGGVALAALPALLVVTAVVLGVGLVQLFWLPVHFLTLFVAAYVVHRELAGRRPPVRFLTSYYLAIAAGGALGGAFCALAAPWLFDRLVEYPVGLVGVCVVLAVRRDSKGVDELNVRTLAVPAVAGGASALLLADVGGVGGSALGPPLIVAASGLAFLAFLTPRRRPWRFALTLAALLAASGLTTGVNGRVLFRERNAFGVLTVTEAPGTGDRRLFHGSTLHGQQARDPNRRDEPLTYFTRSGPVGQVFGAFGGEGKPPLRVGVTGVGVGTLAAYARPGEDWTFYEIDPAVTRVAADPAFFTYLADSRARRLNVVQGDARLSLAREPDATFDLLLLDAFSSDAVPVHLLTREAVGLYRRKLRPGGRLAFNLSNRYLDLAPVLAGLAADAGWACRVRLDGNVPPAETAAGKRGSIWGVLAADEAGLGAIAADPAWRAPAPRPGGRVWTDDAAPLLEYVRLRRPPPGPAP